MSHIVCPSEVHQRFIFVTSTKEYCVSNWPVSIFSANECSNVEYWRNCGMANVSSTAKTLLVQLKYSQILEVVITTPPIVHCQSVESDYPTGFQRPWKRSLWHHNSRFQVHGPPLGLPSQVCQTLPLSLQGCHMWFVHHLNCTFLTSARMNCVSNWPESIFSAIECFNVECWSNCGMANISSTEETLFVLGEIFPDSRSSDYNPTYSWSSIMLIALSYWLEEVLMAS